MATRHFEVLDGLRGTAAVAVVVFHLFEYVFPDPANNPLRHAYLAVDFFFLLSGFVIGHAYDHRWPAMTVRGFFRVRLLRLHPLVLLGVVLGLVDYVFDPFVDEHQSATPLLLTLNFLLGALLLPAPALPNRFDATHSLNSPSWSLMQEYAANAVYALIAPHISRGILAGVVTLAAALLIWAAASHGNLSAGWAWGHFWIAPVRVAFSFFAGLLLYRMGGIIRTKWGSLILPVAMIGIFMSPMAENEGLGNAAWIIIAFPLIVAAGAGSEVSGGMAVLCRFFGRISYPIYILHYPFIDIYAHWLWSTRPSTIAVSTVSTLLVLFLIGFAWAADRYFDAPIRAWLARRVQPSQAPALRGPTELRAEQQA